MKTSTPIHRIALLFNANKVFDREIMAGIGDYLRSTRVTWDLFLDEELRSRPQEILAWHGDGIIADFDDPDICAIFREHKRPLVAVGDCLHDEHFVPNIPYVSTDNGALVSLAYAHLVEMGVSHLAFYSKPESPYNRWAKTREVAFQQCLNRDRLNGEIYRGQEARASDWNLALDELKNWINRLPKPVGIIAVNDGRARQLLQAALLANVVVPEEVAIIGIDNDPLTQILARIPLSSVIQGTRQMGKIAARRLHQLLLQPSHGVIKTGNLQVRVAPAGLNIQASSLRDPLNCPRVMRARHYIRQFFGQGIKAEQVAIYVGISRTALEEDFQRELSCSIHAEILKTRLAEAQKLLADQTLSTQEIALRCGFSSLPYMHAVFRRELACTPSEWRFS